MMMIDGFRALLLLEGYLGLMYDFLGVVGNFVP